MLDYACLGRPAGIESSRLLSHPRHQRNVDVHLQSILGQDTYPNPHRSILSAISSGLAYVQATAPDCQLLRSVGPWMNTEKMFDRPCSLILACIGKRIQRSTFCASTVISAIPLFDQKHIIIPLLATLNLARSIRGPGRQSHPNERDKSCEERLITGFSPTAAVGPTQHGDDSFPFD